MSSIKAALTVEVEAAADGSVQRKHLITVMIDEGDRYGASVNLTAKEARAFLIRLKALTDECPVDVEPLKEG